MPRVIGIDPGTVSVDLCGLEDGRLFLDRTVPTAQALADPDGFVATLEAAGPLDLVAGPSGYGLPLIRAQDATDEDLRLAFLTPPARRGGIAGLTALARAFRQSTIPIVFTPGVIHLTSVPEYRKVNRVDLGTAEKVAAAALAIDRCPGTAGMPDEASLVLLELGGAFTAAVAVAQGRIVDGIGGTAGPLGLRGGGAWDGEVAFLAGEISKDALFQGGAATIAGWDPAGTAPERFDTAASDRERLAFDALVEQAVKAAVTMALAVPELRGFVLSGRLARVARVREALERRLARFGPTWLLDGFAGTAKEGAQGAALLADGLAGGARATLVERLGIREARGTVLDHLHVITSGTARRRLGLA